MNCPYYKNGCDDPEDISCTTKYFHNHCGHERKLDEEVIKQTWKSNLISEIKRKITNHKVKKDTNLSDCKKCDADLIGLGYRQAKRDIISMLDEMEKK